MNNMQMKPYFSSNGFKRKKQGLQGRSMLDLCLDSTFNSLIYSSKQYFTFLNHLRIKYNLKQT